MRKILRRIVCGLPQKLLEWSSKGWVRCDIPKTSTVLGFTLLDQKSLIGEYTFINKFCEVTCATIGNYCSVGSGVRIGSGEHDFNLLSTSSLITGHVAKDLTSKPCEIGHDVWIGTQAFIKRGVTVGNGVVIGAHAVVTRDVPDFAIVVGNPAKVIKYRFSEDIRKKLSSTEWWCKDLEYAKKILSNITA